MSPPKKKSALVATMDKEGRDLLRLAVADITLAWAGIENELALLLAAIIAESPEPKNMRLASAILFTPTSVDARLSIADQALLAITPEIPDQELVELAWKKVHKRAKRLKEIRNTVAHGEMCTFSKKNKKPETRLTAPVFDPRFQRQRGGQPFGLGTNELNHAVQSMYLTRDKIGIFTGLLRQWKSENDAAYKKALRELQDLAQTDEDPLEDSQTPQGK